MTVLFVILKLFSFKWLGREGSGHLSVIGPHASYEQFLCLKMQCYFPALPQMSRAPGVSSRTSLAEDPLLHPGLRVDGPVDDVKEDVRSGKHNPRVLVYGVGVYPNVHVASGWLHLAGDLRVVQRHLGHHSLLAAAVLWHPIIPCGVDIHRPVASDLGVNHHLIRVADATCTRQLGEATQSHADTLNSLIVNATFSKVIKQTKTRKCISLLSVYYFSAHSGHLNNFGMKHL